MAAKYKVIHLRGECISCGACAAICPDYWEMDDEGISHLKGSEQKGEKWEREISTEEARACNQEAVEVCPVGIIKLEKMK
jgi:ferredoxin